jgi:hypothetical protein
MEKRFAFRKELITSNFPFKYELREKNNDEISLLNGVEFIGDDSAVINHAKEDFFDYLKVCFGIKTNSSRPIKIKLRISQSDLEDVCSYKGRITEISEDSITIRAFDDRGIAQAIYDLEDLLSERKQPYLTIGKTKQKPMFSPRMAHSAYDVDVFPNG